MSQLKCKLVWAASVLALHAGLGSSQEPAPAVLPPLTPLPIAGASASVTIAADPSANLQLASAVARTLKQSGKLQHYRMDIQASNGVVELTGRVADLRQKEDAVRLARGVAGVAEVQDRLQVGMDSGLMAVQAVPEQGPPPRKQVDPPAQADGPAMLPAVPGDPMACPPGYYQFPNAPLPIAPSIPSDMFQKTPPLPPYAWPTYAPYNNYSRIAYPTLYPQEAWPGIGPFYPFPKVPTGWRSVSLSWQDGYWWYGRGVSGHDWWRVRYK